MTDLLVRGIKPPNRIERAILEFSLSKYEDRCMICDGRGLVGHSYDDVFECDNCEGYGWVFAEGFMSRFWQFVHQKTLLIYWYRTGQR